MQQLDVFGELFKCSRQRDGQLEAQQGLRSRQNDTRLGEHLVYFCRQRRWLLCFAHYLVSCRKFHDCFQSEPEEPRQKTKGRAHEESGCAAVEVIENNIGAYSQADLEREESPSRVESRGPMNAITVFAAFHNPVLHGRSDQKRY